MPHPILIRGDGWRRAAVCLQFLDESMGRLTGKSLGSGGNRFRVFHLAAGILTAAAALGDSPSSPRREELPILEGLVRPAHVIDLGVSAEGRLALVHVDRGDRIRQGQVLASLESDAEMATVELAKERSKLTAPVEFAQTQVEYTDRKLKQKEELHRQGIATNDEVDELRTSKRLAELALARAKGELRLAEIDYARSRALLEARTVLSPIDGVVMDRRFSPGALVDINLPIFKVAQIEPLYCEVLVPSRFLGTIRPGRKAEVILEFPEPRPLQATVTVVDRVADVASGTFGVRLELPNPDHELPAGVPCRVRFQPQEN